MDSRYNHKEVEPKIYKLWEESGFFNPDNLPDRHEEPFTIIMPPPNANGRLHAGHALFITLEDIIIRYKRMQGFKTLWVPGADHAGFETQIVYEKKLEKEGRSRFQMEPDELFKEIMDFTLENKKYMEDDVRSLGASCDWSREKFTLDKDIIEKTQKTFIKMFNDGLIYRGNRIVNWCIKHQTSLSDVETESAEIKDAKIYNIKYGPLTVATVRPETIFGDVAIAVNPNDERYKKYIGDTIEVKNDVVNLSLKVIGDEYVDIDFGTGALKITPAHDPNDFEIGTRHNLEPVIVIDQFGKLTERAGKYAGQKILEARENIINDLKKLGLLEEMPYSGKADGDNTQIIKTCYKCNKTIEPRLMPQWFVKMKPLAELAMKAVEDKKIKFIPENYEKIFMYWMKNTTDWNISRQIVWGIKIPAKICDKCNTGLPSSNETPVDTCPQCGGKMREDTDTFDTWFSSGQWPLFALGYPDSKDFKNFYPTDVMETGYDLIFKWIPRMVIFGLYLADNVPFHTVYLHGLVNDEKGKKMSKSKGNVMSPIELTDKYGTDALRMALIVGNTPGTDLALSENKIKGYRNFGTKVWNIARFILTNYENLEEEPKLTEEDNKNLEEFTKLYEEVTELLDNYDFNQSSNTIYHYIWHTLADKIIEDYKPRLAEENNDADRAAAIYTLMKLLNGSLKLLHPFMPFITEEIWGLLPIKDKKTKLIIEEW